MSSEKALLSIKNLQIAFGSGATQQVALQNLSFDLKSGEVLGIVGESGSGKSLTSLAIMGLLPKGARVSEQSSILFRTADQTVDLLRVSEEKRRSFRGKRMAMIFQEPMTSLNPVMTCGEQVAESLVHHLKTTAREGRIRTLDLFREVDLPRVEELYDSYPHQLSGGQKQRVMIALALACDPDLIIADEPTTALDVTVQKRVLELLKQLCRKRGVGMVFITHDLGVVSAIADQILVLYRGVVQEIGSKTQVLESPKSSYTAALLACRPRLDAHPHRLAVVSDFTEGMTSDEKPVATAERVDQPAHGSPLIELKDLRVWYPQGRDWRGKPKAYMHAVDGVSFSIYRGETLGLVGESGCGKSTIGRAIVKLAPVHSGSIFYEKGEIGQMRLSEFAPYRKSIQLIFQDPYASLNPRFSLQETLDEVLRMHLKNLSRPERLSRISAILSKVGLPQSALAKYPHEFSGGQRQRISIARALVMEPEFIICDESVSALDVSVQAQVLNLLNDLKEEFGLTYLFISHDLSVVKYMSDRLVVMRKGQIEEIGESEAVYKDPKSEYTRGLIDAIPEI